MTTSLYYNNMQSLQKKLVNKVFYNKSYLKNSEFSKTFFMLDNFYNTSYINKPKKNHSFNIAESINSTPNVFTNKLNKEIKFQLNTCVFSKREVDLGKFHRTLESAKVLSKHFSTLIFLKIVKGGFKCYYFGIVGFLPRTQANKSFKNLLDSIKTMCNLKKFNSFLMFFKKSITVSEKNLLRVSPFTLHNLCVYPTFRKKNYSSQSKKVRIFLNDINVVFVFKTTK